MQNKRAVVPEIKCFSNILGRFITYIASEYGLSELTGQQMHIIGYIEKEQESGRDVFQKDIENKLNVRPSTATVMLKVLEKNGFIRRESVASDARLKRLVLTEKAEDVKARSFTMMASVENILLSGISNEEMDIFFKVIDKMELNLHKNFNIKFNQQQGGK